MRILKIIIVYLVLAFVLIACGDTEATDIVKDSSGLENYFIRIPELIAVEEPRDCFEYAELVTGFSAEVLRGIAATESDFRTDAVGDGGMSFGMFQLHSRWHESRVEKWGEFDPADPFESAVIAGRIMRENLRAFDGDLRSAIAAYRQGVRGVQERGITSWYVDDVLNWRNNYEKVESLLLFCGITNIEAQQNGGSDSRTQDSYKFDDSIAVQISWRGSGGVSD
jgi:hypothetical protein